MNLIINEKNDNKLEEGMVILLIFAFNELKSGDQTFAIQIADTIIVSNLKPEILTDSIPRDYEQISYELELEKPEIKLKITNSNENSKEKSMKKSLKKTMKNSKKNSMKNSKKNSLQKAQKTQGISSTSTGIPYIRTRSGRMVGSMPQIEPNSDNNSSLAKHQKLLIAKKLEEYKLRFESNNFESFEEKSRIVKFDDLQLYKTTKDFPKELKEKEIFVDKKKFAVFFPFEKSHFPLHISLLKTISKFIDNPFAYLRFNFHHFQEKFLIKGLIFPEKPSEFYLKELCFRSSDQYKLSTIQKEVKDLLKTYKAKGLQNQPVEFTEEFVMKTPIISSLKQVKFRPTITGRKTIGNLELHENGFRFVSPKGENVDISFSAINQAFFQPCYKPTDTDYIIVIHFHCNWPVKVSSKAFHDIQVFVEVAGNSKEIGKNDDNEDEDDDYERKKLVKINKEFEEFVKNSERISLGKITFDIPFKELGFMGMPHKGMVFLQPTVNYLTNFIEKPFFVMKIEDIDFVCFERIPVIS